MLRIAGPGIGHRIACIALMFLIACAVPLACNDGELPTANEVPETKVATTLGSTPARTPTASTLPRAAAPPTPVPTATAIPVPTPMPTETSVPIPTPTATPAPTATPTLTPEPTATDTPEPHPTPSTPPVPEPTAAPTPTPTATLVSPPVWPKNPDDYITWRVGDDVNPSIESEARSVVLAMHDYLVGLGFPPIDRPITIFLYHNLDTLASEFEATTGRGLSEGGAGPAFAEGRRVIVSTRDWIALNTSAGRYPEYSSGTRKRILGTNLFNVYQRAVSGLSLHGPRHDVPPVGPQWLSAGAAEFITFEALEASDPEACDVTRGRFAHLSEPVDTPLSEAETSEDFWALEKASRYGFLAVELLAYQTGEGALGAYFASLRHGTTWQEAFEAAFGTTVEKFYQLFDLFRAAGFPVPGAPVPSATMPGAPDYVKWHIGPNVPPEDLQPFVKGFRLMHEYITSLGLPETDQEVRMHVFHKVDGLAPVYNAVTGVKPRCSREWWYEDGKVAEQGKGRIFMTTYDRDHDSLTKITAHELLHAYQSGYSELPGGSQDHEVPKDGPRWLTEGTAEYFAYRAMDAGGEFDYATERGSKRGFVWKAQLADKPLEEMETKEGYEGVPGKYKHFLLAAELLASYVGEEAPLRFHMLQQPGITWQKAFKEAFGMTVEEFYVLFEEHRATGFPEVEIPKSAD